MRARLEHYSAALGLEPYVQFLGYRSDVPILMASWDLLYCPASVKG